MYITQMKAGDDNSISTKQFRVVFVLFLLVVMFPLGLVRIPPLVDYPNHLARMHLLANLNHSPELQQYYEIHWAVLPNLAMDIIIPPISRVIPIYLAGKVFIGLTFILLLTGTTALHRVLYNKTSLWPLLSVLFLYNRAFLWGFLNFLFGIGAMLWLAAAWIACKNKSAIFRVGLFTLASPLLFFSHLFAFGVYGLLIIAVTFHRIGTDRSGNKWTEIGIALSQFIAPAVLFLFFCPTAEAVTSYPIVFGDFSRKLGALFQPFNNYCRPFDAISFLAIFGGITIGLITKQITLSPIMRYPLVLLVVIYIIMPQYLLSVQAVDSRIPTPFAFLIVAATDSKIRGISLKKIIFAVCTCFLIARIGIITFQWRGASIRYHHIESVISKIKNGSRVFTAVTFAGRWHPFPVPVSHFSSISIIEKAAFVPSLFVFPTQQPIRFSEKYVPLSRQTPGPIFSEGRTPDWALIVDNYDYILIINESNFNFKTKIPINAAWSVYNKPNLKLLQTRLVRNQNNSAPNTSYGRK